MVAILKSPVEHGLVPRIYIYKLTADAGGAPCVQNGLLSLAICKPMICRRAIRNDFLFGFAAKSLHPDNRLIYVARVTEKLCDEKYYKDTRYARRDDCIYKCKAGRFKWKEGSLHHGKNFGSAMAWAASCRGWSQ